MARLDQAAKRVQAALDRLEQAVEGRGGAAAQRKALESARSETAAMQEIAGTVATRLDSTITRLKATLEA